MKKRIYTVIVVALCAFLMGCSEKETESTNSVLKKQETKDKKEGRDNQEEVPAQTTKADREADSKDDGVENTEQDSLKVVNIYQVGEDGSEIIAVKEEVKNEYDIWEKLIEAGILDENCELLSFRLDKDAKTIDINFNQGVGNRIRSMGTAGEQAIVGCIANTYLEAYECDKIKLLEEGESLETGHGALLDGYMEKFDF